MHLNTIKRKLVPRVDSIESIAPLLFSSSRDPSKSSEILPTPDYLKLDLNANYGVSANEIESISERSDEENSQNYSLSKLSNQGKLIYFFIFM